MSIRGIDSPGCLFHISTAVNWHVWYLADDAAKRLLTALIVKAAEEFHVAILAFVVMSNHLHLVVQSPPLEWFRRLTSRRTKCRHLRPWPRGHQKASVISQFMGRIRRGVSGVRQQQLGITGHFWDGDYDARKIWSPRSLTRRIAYDHRNPVRAGMVRRPEDYVWSSARYWSSGTSVAVPITLDTRPFDMDVDTLRNQVLFYQESRAFDDLKSKVPNGKLDWDTDAGLDEIESVLQELDPGRFSCGTGAASS
jgi:REP element-mobilizing transposase RayT